MLGIFLPIASWSYDDDDISKALADFISTLMLNTQTVNRGTSLCIYGSDDISQYLVNKEKISSVLDEDISKKHSYKHCRIIYIAKNKEKYVRSFIDILNQAGAPTVATFESFVNNGGMIFVDIGRRDFELTVNSQSFKASGAKIDSSIMALIVNNKSR